MTDTYSVEFAKKVIEKEIERLTKELDRLNDLGLDEVSKKTRELIEKQKLMLENAQEEQERIEEMEGSYTKKDYDNPKIDIRDKKIEKLETKMDKVTEKVVNYEAIGNERRRYKEAIKYNKLKAKKGKIEAKQRKIVNKKVLDKIKKLSSEDKADIKAAKQGEREEKLEAVIDKKNEAIMNRAYSKDLIKTTHGKIKKPLRAVIEGTKIIKDDVIIAISFLREKRLKAHLGVLGVKNGIFEGMTKTKDSIADKIKDKFGNIKDKLNDKLNDVTDFIKGR